ncbi:MAG: DUF1963 domain-containing protein [Candidatus Dojkabacteria bacterium]
MVWNNYFIAAGYTFTSQLGGYASFTQEDPRKYTPAIRDEILFLQLASDPELGLMWGDVGIANFFITTTNLENQEFTRLLYNWDCS